MWQIVFNLMSRSAKSPQKMASSSRLWVCVRPDVVPECPQQDKMGLALPFCSRAA